MYMGGEGGKQVCPLISRTGCYLLRDLTRQCVAFWLWSIPFPIPGVVNSPDRKADCKSRRLSVCTVSNLHGLDSINSVMHAQSVLCSRCYLERYTSSTSGLVVTAVSQTVQ